MIDRVAGRLGRRLVEVPVGFKWFVEGLLAGTLGFGGEESAGAAFLRADGTVWTTDKDGILLGLLAAEMTAVTGRDPGERYRELTRELGESAYRRIDAPAAPAEKARLARLSPEQFDVTELAGERITAALTATPGAARHAIGGLKVIAPSAWFAARPSGTENVYKLYAESFKGEDHLQRVLAEAQTLIARALGTRLPEERASA
jgi:phosphoglucomutase